MRLVIALQPAFDTGKMSGLPMNYDYTQRGYLLADGCKDLIDVLKPKLSPARPTFYSPPIKSTPVPVVGELFVSERTTVRELAVLLGQKEFHIIADLLELCVVAKVDEPLPFDIIARLLLKHGYIAKLAP